jgi:hypothetical protein
MPLTNLTQITGPGIQTTTNLQVNDGQFTGIVTATKFVGDGSDLTSLPAGLGTALSANAGTPLNNIYYVNNILHITEHSTVDVPGTASKAYTQYTEIQVEDNVNLTVGGDCTFIPDVLNFFETP